MRRPPRWGVSPALPASANVLLAVLWICSTAGGWGGDAFCRGERGCLDDYRRVVELSVALAAPAAVFGGLGWLMLRDRQEELDTLLLTTALLWAAAEGVLFVGGHLLT